MLSSIGWSQLTAAQQQKIPAEYQNKDIPISVIEDSGIELSAAQKSIFNGTSVQKDEITYKVTDYETEPRDTSFWDKAAEVGKKVLVGSGVGIAAGLVASLAFPVWGAVACGILAGVGAYMFASKKAREAKQKAQQNVPQYQAPINKQPEQKVADAPKEEEKPAETPKAEKPAEEKKSAEKPKTTETPKAEKPVEEKKPAETPKTEKAEEPAPKETVVEKTVIEPLNETPEQVEKNVIQHDISSKRRRAIDLPVSELTPELREFRIENPRPGSDLKKLRKKLEDVEKFEAEHVGTGGFLPSASKLRAQIEEIENADKKEKELKERISELEAEISNFGETKWYNITKNYKKHELEKLKEELNNLY